MNNTNNTGAEMKDLIKLTVNAIVRDGAIKTFINATNEERVTMAIEYAQKETELFANFSAEYSNNTQARKAFQTLILNMGV